MLEHKGLTPMAARMRGMSHPGEAKPAGGMTKPHDQEAGGEEHFGSDTQGKDKHPEGGDGMHHHTLHEHEDGSYSSVHTHPDGHVTHATHDNYSEAMDHMHEMHGEAEDEGEHEDHAADNSNDTDDEDLAGMYDSEAN